MTPKGGVSNTTARYAAVAMALFGLSHPVLALIIDLGAYASPAAVGAEINAASGVVASVTPGSAAAAAGLRAGDRVDFNRAGATMHLWLWDSWFPVAKPFVLPITRQVQQLSVTIMARPPPLGAGRLTYDVVAIVFGLIVMILACAAIFARADRLTIAFFSFCLFYTTSNNTVWYRISPPFVTPFTALEAVLPVLAGTIGFLYLCLRFPTGEAVGGWRTVDRCIPAFAILLGTVYYAHFYESAFFTGEPGVLFSLNVLLVLTGSIAGLLAYVSRFWKTRGPEVTRMRWVAAAIVVYIASLLIFFIDQIVSRGRTPWVTWLFNFNPAAFAFAYALIKGRIIDIRIVGGRAIIYALITSIPVALLAFADWFFARRLEDARLATAFEIGIAIGFSFWLQAVHRRINRFSERVFFAARHQAFSRMHRLTRALPFSEKVETIESLLTEETASIMGFTSAALFRAEDGRYVRTAAVEWGDAAESLDADDPVVLFTRSEHSGVHLTESPQSKTRLPGGAAKPVFALPVVVGRRVIAVVLYGGHRDGEPIDSEEEQLLTGAAHAAATAYEHLHALERERENAALRAKLEALTGMA